MERERRIAPPASAEADPTAAERAVDVKSLLCERLGNPAATGPEAPLRVTRRAPAPLPPNAVRIRVAAAALNFADLLQVQGKYQVRPRLPFVPGSECSGVVIEVSSAAPRSSSRSRKNILETNQPLIIDHCPRQNSRPGATCAL